MLAQLKLLWTWLVHNPMKVLAGVFSFVLGVALWRLRTENKSATMSDVLTERKLTKAVAEKEAMAVDLISQGDDKHEEVERLRQEVAASKRRVVEIRKGVSTEGKSDEEVAELFTGAGF